jgi:hypothetical protein
VSTVILIKTIDVFLIAYKPSTQLLQGGILKDEPCSGSTSKEYWQEKYSWPEKILLTCRFVEI